MTHQLSPTLLHVLQILNDGEIHPGSDMAKQLGISRTAVWKIIQRLKKFEIDIEVQHQGYRLIEPILIIEKAKIKKILKNKDIHLEVFESIASTSDYLKSTRAISKPVVCLAEYQKNGRGRLGRRWYSPFGRNIYFSIRFNFEKDVSGFSGFSLVIGILMAQVLESLNAHLKPMLKWPNDIYLGDKKVGGILIDLMAEANGSCLAIISIGLNVNMKNEQIPIDQPWTSLEHILNQNLDRNELVAKIIDSLIKGIEDYNEQGLKPFLELWPKYDYLAKRRVTVQVGQNQSSGIAQGIDENGSLILELSQGIQKNFSSGDTSVC